MSIRGLTALRRSITLGRPHPTTTHHYCSTDLAPHTLSWTCCRVGTVASGAAVPEIFHKSGSSDVADKKLHKDFLECVPGNARSIDAVTATTTRRHLALLRADPAPSRTPPCRPSHPNAESSKIRNPNMSATPSDRPHASSLQQAAPARGKLGARADEPQPHSLLAAKALRIFFVFSSLWGGLQV